MKFDKHRKMLKRQHVAYLDFEATLKKCPKPSEESKNVLIAKHVPNSACILLDNATHPSKSRLWCEVSDDISLHIIEELSMMQEDMVKDININEKMCMTEANVLDFQNAACCYLCEEEFVKTKRKKRGGGWVERLDKNRDHVHATGLYRGAACTKCNLDHHPDKYLTVIAHNLRGYDGHFFIREAFRIAKELNITNISAIPNSNEKFMSFTIGRLKFIDSFQFMGSSLEKLVENLFDKEDKYKHFHHMKREFPNHLDLLCRKGIYPYTWFDDTKKFKYKGLPPIEDFYSDLKQEKPSEEDYQHALNVYYTLNCEVFQDYHITYLKTDVLLLADVFTRFRETCLESYQLDPANYISAPGLAWDAMLKMTGIELDLISDLELFSFFEDMKRGGLCFVGSKRHAKANNKYLADFDSSKPSTYIMCWDANNLHGWSMMQALPCRNIKFYKEFSLEDILDTADDAPTGYA
jgi:hypothetical protein